MIYAKCYISIDFGPFGFQAELTISKLIIGLGDQGEPLITILVPDDADAVCSVELFREYTGSVFCVSGGVLNRLPAFAGMASRNVYPIFSTQILTRVAFILI